MSQEIRPPSIPTWLMQAVTDRLRSGTPVDRQRAGALLAALRTARKRKLHIVPPQNFVDPDPVRWITTHFRVPETPDHHLYLAPYQASALREALSRDASGLFRYSTVIWSDIKKSIKSTIAAAVALWMAFQNPWGQVILVANDLKQADSRVGFYLRRAIELNPDLNAACKMSASSYRVILSNHATIEAVPIDPTGEAGSNADFIVFSELWGAHQDAQSRMWTEMTLSPTKYGRSLRWVETYAGYTGESVLLERLWNDLVHPFYDNKAKTFHPSFEWAKQLHPPLPIFASPAARALVLWNDTPRLSWQTQDYYSQEQAVLLPGEFSRIHRNQWVSSTESFVPLEWWDACQVPAMPALQTNEALIVVGDAGISSDSFAVVAVSRKDPAYEVLRKLEHKLETPGSNGASDPYEDKSVYQVRYCRVWYPPQGSKLDFGMPDGPEQELRRLFREHNVTEFAYDPYQLEDMASRFRNEAIVNTYAFSQGIDRLVSDKALYDIIRSRRVQHSGEPDLREHILNANAEHQGKDDKSLRLVKKSESRKIDAAVALSMAISRAAYWQI